MVADKDEEMMVKVTHDTQHNEKLAAKDIELRWRKRSTRRRAPYCETVTYGQRREEGAARVTGKARHGRGDDAADRFCVCVCAL